MTKTEEELKKMGFMQIKKHCKSLDIEITFGDTKSTMIKKILAKDPPPIQPKKLTKEEQIKQQLTDTNIYNDDEKKQNIANTINYDDNAYKNNQLSTSEAIKVVKTYCPESGRITLYAAYSSIFKASELQNLTISQFINALNTGNEKVLGTKNITLLSQVLDQWDDNVSNNAWSLCKTHLKDFHPPPDCPHSDKLMFAVFYIPGIIQKLRLMVKILNAREEVIDLLYFMDTFNASMKEIITNDAYRKIYLATIILSKFRNEDVELKGFEKYKDIIDFLQKISLQPTAKEIFQSRRWNKLKEKGKLVEEINRPQFVMSDADFNKIRAKAIKFGSAVQPQMARVLHSEVDEKTKRENIRKDIGTQIDTKALQNKLQSALAHKLGTNGGGNGDENKSEENDDGKDDEKFLENDDNMDGDIDLSKYRKMLSIGVKLDAVLREMKSNGISSVIIDQFIAEQDMKNDQNKKKTENVKNDENGVSASKPAVRPRLPNALMASINNAAAPAPAPPPVPAPVPVAAAIPNPPRRRPYGVHPVGAPQPFIGNGHGQNAPHPFPYFAAGNGQNAMIASSVIPTEHSNVGINWQRAINSCTSMINRLNRLRVLTHGLDIQMYHAQQSEEKKNDDNDNDEDEEHKQDFYDDTFKFYVAQIARINQGLGDWMRKSTENKDIVKKLEMDYHSRFRPQMFKELTSSSYTALSEAANRYDDDMIVPEDIIGVIWMFVKPFDVLIELKFAVDTINEFFNKDKKEISVKKLPIQSHRGYHLDLMYDI